MKMDTFTVLPLTTWDMKYWLKPTVDPSNNFFPTLLPPLLLPFDAMDEEEDVGGEDEFWKSNENSQCNSHVVLEFLVSV